MAAESWRNRVRRFLFLLALLAPVLGVHAAPAPTIDPASYEIAQLARVSGQANPTYTLTARASVYNLGSLARKVTATLTGGPGEYLVLDGELRFGDVPHTPIDHPCTSRDTFRLRFVLPSSWHPSRAHEYAYVLMAGLEWRVDCTNCGSNSPPVANAGADQSAFVQQLVTLDGSGSSDPDGDAITWSWSIVTRPAGSTAELTNAQSVGPTLTPDREGEYTIRLIVRDGRLASAPDTVVVSTLNSAPVANAGADQTAFVSQRVQLDGSASSDVDGDALTYAWQVTGRPTASTAEIDRPSEVNPTFTPDAPGRYLIELVVDDGTVSSAPDTMEISTANSRPVAEAGANQTARVGETVSLDGSGSRDADEDPLTYRWSLTARPAGSSAALAGADTVNPSLPIDRAGTYVAQLIVNDGESDSDADTTAVSTVNSPPVAVPGANQVVHFGATVRLDGSGSSDPDDDALTFSWALLSIPEASGAVLSDATATAPTFVADRPGTYVVQLIVNDGTVNGAPASLTVTAQNVAPIARDDAANTAAGSAVTVDVLANDTDADGDALRVESVTQPSNGTAALAPVGVIYTPGAGFSGLDAFTYRITDGADFAVATVRVTVDAPTNAPPIADAGPDQSGYAGDVFQLDGRASRDPDGATLTFAWTQVAGPAATLTGADTATAQLDTTAPGSYRIRLTVGDGLAIATDEVTVEAAALPALSIEGVTVTEGDVGQTTASFRVTLSAPIGRRVTAAFVTQDGTATGGSDYTPAAGTIVFEPGETQPRTIDVNVLGDTAVEADETFTVSLASPVNATLAVVQATGTITNDDVAPPAGPQVAALGPRTVVAPTRTARMQVVLDAIAGAGGVRVLLTSSNPALATVPADITVPEGEGAVFIELTAGAAPGTATLTASTLGGTSRSAQLVVRVETSRALIEAAVQAGTITQEEGFVYRLLAEFGASGLPAEYAGAQSSGLDSQVFYELGDRIDALSDAQRAAIERFLLPPVYRGSWADAVLGPPAPAPVFGLASMAPQPEVRRDPVVGYTACREDGNEELLPYVQFYDTENFRIWYPRFPDDHPQRADNPRAERVAQILRNTAERALTVLTGGQTAARFRQPMSDSGLTCNGGSGRIDVYLAGRWWSSGQVDGLGFAGDTAGYTMPYYLRAESSPAYIVLNYDHVYASTADRTERRTRSFFTHELMHVIDYGYAKQGPIGSYTWLKDAMATWAMDFVWPQDQEEHVFADPYFEVESRYPLNFDDPRTLAASMSGYPEYVFFFWAHRRYNGGPDSQPTLMMQVLSEAERVGSIDAVAIALVLAQSGAGQQPGGFGTAWPEFALASWNDYEGGVQDDFFRWDTLRSGMRARFQRARNWLTTEISFTAPDTDQGFFSGDAEQQLPVGAGGRVVAPLSSMYHHVTIPENAALAFLLVDNDLADPDNAPPDDVLQRIEVLIRTDEGWQAPVDWTFERFPMFCLDELESRVRELVLVYTNSAPPPRGLGNGVSVSTLNNWRWDVGDEELGPDAIMTSVGCLRWRLNSSSIEDRVFGSTLVTQGSARGEVVLERETLAAYDTPDGPVVEATFVNLQGGGTFTFQQNVAGECPLQTGPFDGPIGPRDAGLSISLISRDPLVRHRGVAGGGGSLARNVPWRSCDDSGVLDTSAPWMAISLTNIRQVEGRELTGLEVDVQPGRTVTAGYSLSAERE